MERIATITPIATRNTPFTISLMMPQRMPNTPKAVRIIKPHIANPMCCAICLKFAVAVISSLFLIFLFLMQALIVLINFILLELLKMKR